MATSDSLLRMILFDSVKNIGFTDFFQKKGFNADTVASYQCGFLPDGLAPFSKEIGDNEDLLSCYKYVIPNFDLNGNLVYLLIKSDKTVIHENVPFEIDPTYFLGDFYGKLWNEKVLFENHPVIFVVENWSDALSLIECDCDAISLNRVANVAELWKILLKYEKSRDHFFVAACDNDYYGQKSNSNLNRIFSSMNCKILELSEFPIGVKDCNEWLCYDRFSFEEALIRIKDV